MIPRILHQTWKSTTIPRKVRRYVDSWRQFEKLEFRLHTDEQLRDLVIQHFPQHKHSYDNFERNIERFDFARYVLMHAYGGIYADLDMECLRSLEPLLDFDGPIMGTEPVEHAAVYRVEQVISNALLISPPAHPFWSELLDYIVANYSPRGNVVYNTGPMALTKFHESHPERYSGVQILPPAAFCPLLDPFRGGKREGRFKHVSHHCSIQDAYTAHHWVHSYNTLFYRAKTSLLSGLQGLRKHFHEAAGNYDARYYQGPLPDDERQQCLRETFAECARVMKDHRIDVWLMYGSLLGWHRAQGIIPWDNDIDMGTFYNDLYRMQAISYEHPRYLIEVNPNHQQRRPQRANSVDARFIDKQTGVFVDIFGYDRADARGMVKDKQRGEFLAANMYPLQDCVFEGVNTLCPHNPLGILHSTYGTDLEPDHRWDGQGWVKIEQVSRAVASTSAASEEPAASRLEA